MSEQPPKSPPIGVDGKYRWLYELTLLNNPKRLFLFWRIGFVLVALLALYLGLTSRSVEDGFFAILLRTFGIGLLIMTGVLVILMLILKKLGIGNKLMLYQMDDDGLQLFKLQKHVSKYDMQKSLAILTGQMKGDPAAPASAVLSEVKSHDKIAYHAVSTVSYRRFWRQIRVKSGMRAYDVFASKAQAEFVLNTIFTKSAKARMAKKG